MRFQNIQHGFNSGELSPLLNTRTEINPYIYGAKDITNCYVLLQGGLKKRGGLTHVDVLKNNTRSVKLLPFTYNNDNAYVLCLNAGFIEFIKNKQFITNTDNTRVSISHPYTDQQLPQLKYTQYQSVMYITHPNHPPKQLIRTNDTTWSLTDIDVTYDALSNQTFDNGFISFKIVSTPFNEAKTTSTTTNTVNTNNIVTQSTSNTNTSDVRKHFKIGDKFTFTTDGTGNFTTPVSTIKDGFLVGYIIVIDAEPTNDPAQTWTITLIYRDELEERWSVVGSKSGKVKVQWYEDNYPAVCCFHQQRLFFASTKSKPLTIWGSRVGDFLDFTLGLNDNGVSFQIDNNTRDNIINLESSRVLLPLTHSAEFTLTGSIDRGITSQTTTIKKQTLKGSANIKAKQVGDEMLFVDKTTKHVLAISYDFQSDSNIAPDITIMSNHIAEDGFIDMTFEYGKNIMWLVNKNGRLLSLTHNREQSVTGWTKHETHQGKFKAVTCITSQEKDIVYAVVERDNVFHLDYIDDDVYVDDADVINVDTKQTQFETHFNINEKVIINADGNNLGEHTVKNINGKNTITLKQPASKVQIGHPIKANITMFNPAIVTRSGTTVGTPTSIIEPTIFYYNTTIMTVNAVDIPLDTISTFDTSPPIKTGSHRLTTLGWDENLTISHNFPNPFALLGVSYSVVLGKQG